MDNILKLLLGVLGVAGLITFVTANLPFESTPPVTAVAAANPPPPVNENNGEAPPEEIIDEGSPEEDGDDILAVGEPVIDGNPYGSNNQQNMQNEVQIPQEQIPNASYNYAQAPMQNYNIPQVNMPQQMSGEIAPVDSGQ